MTRGWRRLRLLSCAGNAYNHDYHGETADGSQQLPMLNVFRRDGDTIRHFVIILLVGILSGTYSSIFNAAPILVVWENREWKNWFKKKEQPATA